MAGIEDHGAELAALKASSPRNFFFPFKSVQIGNGTMPAIPETRGNHTTPAMV